RADDADLGKRGDAAAHAIELPAVRIGGPDCGEEDLVPRAPVTRQVTLVKHDRLARAAAHEHGRNLLLLHVATARLESFAQVSRSCTVPIPHRLRFPAKSAP